MKTRPVLVLSMSLTLLSSACVSPTRLRDSVADLRREQAATSTALVKRMQQLEQHVSATQDARDEQRNIDREAQRLAVKIIDERIGLLEHETLNRLDAEAAARANLMDDLHEAIGELDRKVHDTLEGNYAALAESHRAFSRRMEDISARLDQAVLAQAKARKAREADLKENLYELEARLTTQIQNEAIARTDEFRRLDMLAQEIEQRLSDTIVKEALARERQDNALARRMHEAPDNPLATGTSPTQGPTYGPTGRPGHAAPAAP